MARTPKITSARIKVMQLPHAKGLPLPAYQSAQAAGMDLLAAIDENEVLRIARGARVLVPTGLVLELPAGTEAQVRPRSGLAAKHGITVLNSPGTIDADYRGEVQVILVNLGQQPYVIERGERIAQLVVAPVMRGQLVAAKVVAKSARGGGGFGSTGKTAAGKPGTGKPGTRKAALAKAKPANKKSRPTTGPRRTSR